jgi:hypothetical protein
MFKVDSSYIPIVMQASCFHQMKEAQVYINSN